MHQHIGMRQQLLHDARGFGVLEVERQTFFGPVGPHKMGCQAPHTRVVTTCKVAGAGAFNFDYTGPLVGQLAGTKRGCNGVLQRHHGNAF